MQKVKQVLLFTLILSIFASFTPADSPKINWITVQQLHELYAKEPRPVLFDIYTDWCGWCKEMDRTTYRNEKLVNYINSHYYAVRYNAESRDTVTYNGKTYHYNERIQTNDLALYLTFGRPEYPTTVFLGTLDAQPAPLSGYMKPKAMEAPLKFFGERADLTQTFVEFNKKMKKEW